jgi:hypothetical protein
MRITGKYFMAVVAIVTIMACSNDRPIKGTPASGVDELRVGMSPLQVSNIIGAPQFERAYPGEANRICRSYLYGNGEPPLYAIALFIDDRLVTAADAFTKPCEEG